MPNLPNAWSCLAKGRKIVENRAPYLSDTVASLRYVSEPRIPTAGITKGLVLAFNPEYVEKIAEQNIQYVASMVLHETFHFINGHTDTLDDSGLDPKIANIAQDLEVNARLRRWGFQIMDNWLTPEQYELPDLKDWRWYYKRLMEEVAASAKSASKDPNENKEGTGQDEQDSTEQGAGTPGSASNQSSPGGTGNLSSEHLWKATEGPLKDIADQLDERVGHSDIGKSGIRQELEDRINSTDPGDLPGDIRSFLKKPPPVPEKKIPWNQQLRKALQSMSGNIEDGFSDYSYARPSRRAFLRNEIRPGLVAYTSEVCFVLDTSGSVDEEMLAVAFRESFEALKTTGSDACWLLQADTRVAEEPRRISLRKLKDPSSIQIVGRGGTHFDDALRRAEKLKPRPSIIVYMTDGYGNVTYKPSIPVLWCIIRSDMEMPFGQVVYAK